MEIAVWNNPGCFLWSEMIVTLKPINIGALADWDTGNVTDMSSMFDGCSSLTDLNALINWDTSAVNNMKAMFNGISQLTDTSVLNDWDSFKYIQILPICS